MSFSCRSAFRRFDKGRKRRVRRATLLRIPTDGHFSAHRKRCRLLSEPAQGGAMALSKEDRIGRSATIVPCPALSNAALATLATSGPRRCDATAANGARLRRQHDRWPGQSWSCDPHGRKVRAAGKHRSIGCWRRHESSHANHLDVLEGAEDAGIEMKTAACQRAFWPRSRAPSSSAP